jgi:membrane fusion protein (multidrug efflux system)
MAEHALSQAESDLAGAQSAAASARTAANVSGTHPLILAALAQRDRAALDVARTVVRAPADGVASQTDKVQVGQMIIAGVPTLSLVISDRRYVEANFKETDLEKMRIGQAATIKLDAYPSQPLTGHVESIGAGTGSEFSVLPAQNATGNWVKVVQRVPVRIAIDSSNVPLLAGLSATVTVTTKTDRKP